MNDGVRPIILPGMALQDTLMAAIQAHCDAVGIATTTFGQRVVGDTQLVDRVRRGRVTIGMADRILQYLAGHGNQRQDDTRVIPSKAA